METRTALTASMHLPPRPMAHRADPGAPAPVSHRPGLDPTSAFGPPQDLIGAVNASRIAALQGAVAIPALDRPGRIDQTAATAYRRSHEAVLGHVPVLPLDRVP